MSRIEGRRLFGRKIQDMLGKEPRPVRYYFVNLGSLRVGALAALGDRDAEFLPVMNATDIDTRIDMCGIWEERLKSDAEADLTPVESIERWRGVPGRPNTGEIDPAADLYTCPDMPALDQILNPGTEPPEDIVGKFLSDPVFLAGREWDTFVTTEVDTGYKIRAEGEILYRPVRKDETIIGYLWASNPENARGYVPRPVAGAPAWQAEGWWIDQAAEAAGRGMTPVEALRERIAAPEDPNGGYLDPADQEQTASSPQELTRRAQGIS